MANWSVLDGQAAVTVFNDHLQDADAVVARLQPFDVVCVMRERTPMTGAVISRLPKLRLIASTAHRNASIDVEAAADRGQHRQTAGTAVAANRLICESTPSLIHSHFPF
jgi:phosphoglycerate dehydrogenase-like enzyme